MTDRLYLSDPYLARLDAQVVSCTPVKGGFAVVLDRTICYPRGGGQPCEPATLAGVTIADCYEEGEQVLHIVPTPVALGPAELCIDAQARLDHMQQHLGEHILSRVIENRFGGKISILRIEPESAHIEIDRPLTPAQLAQAELEANQVIGQNLPVRSLQVTPQEAAERYGVPVAKANAHSVVRVVEIQGFDYNGCGGTHCHTTGEVGRLLVCGTKSVRGQFRIYYQCGGRADAELTARTEGLLTVQQALGVELLPELVEKAPAVFARKLALEEENRALKDRLVELEAAQLALTARRADGRLFASAILEGGDAKQVKAVCDRVLADHDALLLYAVPAGGQLSLIFGRSKSREPEPNLGGLLRQLATEHGGKGGGSAISAQGMMQDTPEARAAFGDLCARLEADMG